MLETVSFPVYAESMAEYENPEEVIRSAHSMGLDGVETIWGDDDTIDTLPDGFSVGHHLTFYPDWLDFWRGDEAALLRKFGSREAYTTLYGGTDREALLSLFRRDLAQAERLGAKYVVFHVSDVSLEEAYTYQWEHSHREVLDASIEVLNLLFGERHYPFALLVENQWWPGFTFIDPEETGHLLHGIRHPDKGIMLDIGHLMNTNTALESEAEGIIYIHKMLDEHGELCRFIRGIHLHQSLSGAYVRASTGKLPGHMAEDYLTRFGNSYAHVLQIDRHKPWTDPAIAEAISRIGPEFLTHELSCKNREAREQVVSCQRATLKKGGLFLPDGKAAPFGEKML